MLPSVPDGHRCQPEDVGRSLHERNERIKSEAEEGIPVTGGAA
jgi:hypothetical protein